MKNLTIKKIALGLVLAGYAASGAFAALTATTGNTIKGHAPFVNAPSLNPTVADYAASKVDIEVTRGGSAIPSSGAGSNWQTGDVISLKYKTVDEDGDTEGTGFVTGKTVIFSYYIPNASGSGGTWTSSASSDVTVTAGVAKWTIPNGALNATHISFAIRPTTEFGDPQQNNWAKGLINNAAVPADGGNNTNPDGVDPTDPDGPGGDKAKGNGPVKPGNTYTITIHEATIASGGAITYVTDMTPTTAPNPTIGKTYAVEVLDSITSADVTSSFTYAWTLTGSATWGTLAAIPAATTQLTAVAGTTITGVAHKLDVNSVYATTTNGYKAGAQKYKLTVTTL